MKLFYFCAIVYFTSCSIASQTIYGGKTPKIESQQSITDWLSKEKLPTQQVATVAPEGFFDIFLSYSDGVKIFNAKGELLKYGYKNGKFCAEKLDQEITHLQPTKVIGLKYELAPTIKSHIHLTELQEALRTLNGQTLTAIKTDSVDFVIIIPFSLSGGKTLQTKDIRNYLSAVVQNKNASFSVWLVNFDKQQWWGEEWNRKIVYKQ